MLLRNLGRTNCLTHIPEDIKLELKDGVLTLKAGSKLYVPNGKTEQEYYKYDDSQNLINLADSDNTTLITNGKMVTGNRYKWSTTQTYNLNNPVEANKIYVTFSDSTCQANAYLNTTITAITNKGEFTLISKNFGYGVAANETIEYELPIQTTTSGIRIYIQSNARSSSYSYAQVTIGVSANKVVESTSTDYDYIVQTGQNVFDEVVIESDKQLTVSDSSSTSSESGWFVFYGSQDWARNSKIINNFSGASSPSLSGNYAVWYDTVNNVIKYTNDKGATWNTKNITLPICSLTRTSGIATSIDQVFNGFGYIGSSWFALPNVRGLVSDGYNPDGTYKVINATINEVKIQTLTSVDSATRYMLLGNNLTGYWTTGAVEYKQDENLLYINGQVYARLIAGTFVCTDGKITSLTPNPVKTTDDYKPYMLTTKKRKYFKYGYESWTQPKVSANTTAVDGGDIVITATSGSSGGSPNYPWQAMDGLKSGTNFWEVGVCPSWWQVKFPYKLKITGVKYYKANNDANNTTSVAFYTSSSKTTKIGETLSTNGSAWQGFSVSGIPSEGIITDTLYVELLEIVSGYTSIGEIEITAQKQYSYESTSDNYDYYEDVDVKKYLFAKGEKKYYKYNYTNWTQPILTANGTLGGDSFACSQSSSWEEQVFWKLFASSPKNYHSAAGLPQWVLWYNPNPLKVTKLFFNGHASGNIGNGIIQACNDNSNWEDILSFSNTNTTEDFEIDLSSNNKAYKYWRIYITSCYYKPSIGYCCLIDVGFKITAQEQSIVEGTKDDYDYFEYESFKLY